MKVKLELQKDGAVLQEGVYEISDADSFGAACAQVWERVIESKFRNASSVGALYDMLDENVLDQLHGATITISKP